MGSNQAVYLMDVSNKATSYYMKKKKNNKWGTPKKKNNNNNDNNFRNNMGGYNDGQMNSNVYLCSENDASGVVGQSLF
jgi:hypothetical protein